jgi:hypothetical protein
MTPAPTRAFGRRDLLRGAAAASIGGALLGPAGARAASGAGVPTDGAPNDRTKAFEFFADPDLNFQLLFALGATGYGAAETGEVLAAFDRIHARGDGYDAAYAEFLALGRQLRDLADGFAAKGRTVSARSAYLRSAMYYDQALFFVLATPDATRTHEGQVYQLMESAWAHAAALFQPRFERVKIPYGKATLPGWLLVPPGPARRRPTVILNNGSDAQNIDMWVYGGAAALERGHNALIFEGPGQGANLFLRSMPFIPDWEKVVTPVVDFLRARPEVDRRRIAIIGQSFGGYLVPRAAAFEHRLAAVVADPGAVDCFVDWQQGLPAFLVDLIEQGKRAEFDAAWAGGADLSRKTAFFVAKRSEIYGNGSFYDRMRAAREYTLPAVLVNRISAPTALTQAQDEQSFPGQSQTLYDELRVDRRILPFTVAEGAQFHCEPMAPQLRNERVFDWLEANLRPTS